MFEKYGQRLSGCSGSNEQLKTAVSDHLVWAVFPVDRECTRISDSAPFRVAWAPSLSLRVTHFCLVLYPHHGNRHDHSAASQRQRTRGTRGSSASAVSSAARVRRAAIAGRWHRRITPQRANRWRWPRGGSQWLLCPCFLCCGSFHAPKEGGALPSVPGSRCKRAVSCAARCARQGLVTLKSVIFAVTTEPPPPQGLGISRPPD